VEENEVVLEYEGYPTFNDVEDFDLKAYNRAQIVINIVEDLTKSGASKESCWEKVREYVNKFPREELIFVFLSLPDARAARVVNPSAFGYN
jgi:hypothetical protein